MLCQYHLEMFKSYIATDYYCSQQNNKEKISDTISTTEKRENNLSAQQQKQQEQEQEQEQQQQQQQQQL